MKTKMLFTALITMGLAGFSLPMANGQIQPVQKSSATPQVKSVHLSLSPVKLSATEIKTSFTEAEWTVKATPERKMYTTQSSALQVINVTSPADNEIWEAGKEYQFKWNGAQNDVKITLNSYNHNWEQVGQYLVTSRAPNTGSYLFRVPMQCVKEPRTRVHIETIDNKGSGYAPGMINIYAQPVDLECLIVDSELRWHTTCYVVYAEHKRWLQFNVLMRNKGILSPVSIAQVLVRIIKEPENIVVYQEDWGFSGIYYHDWYRLPEPRKINISSWEAYPYYKDNHVNFENGTYRVEVELDPQNRLGEIQDLRYDNKYIERWNIVPE